MSQSEGDLRLRRGRRARNSLTHGSLVWRPPLLLRRVGGAQVDDCWKGCGSGWRRQRGRELGAQRHVTLPEENKDMLKEYLAKQGTQSAVGDLDHIAAHIKEGEARDGGRRCRGARGEKRTCGEVLHSCRCAARR